MKKYNLKHRIEYKVINLNIDQEWNCTEKKQDERNNTRTQVFLHFRDIQARKRHKR